MEESAGLRPSLKLFSTRKPLSDCTNSSNPPLSSASPPAPGSLDVDVSVLVSVYCSGKHTLDERKHKKKAVANLVSSRPNPKISNIRNKSDGVEGLDLPKAKPLTVPCRKKRRAVYYEKCKSKDAQLQDFIEKQNTYFKEIDEFILSEEEVDSIDELN